MATDAFFAAAGPDRANAANRWKTHARRSGTHGSICARGTGKSCRLWRRISAPVAWTTRAVRWCFWSGREVPEKPLAWQNWPCASVRSSNARPVRLLSLDMSRATAHLQLQSVATTYKMAFQEVPAAYLLPGLIAEARQKETIFVDTPGYTGADANAADAAAAALAECPQLDVHLVVPGYMKARDLRLCIEKYARFRPTKLLVTKMDETHSFGSIFSEAARAGLKLSFAGARSRHPARHSPGVLRGSAEHGDGARKGTRSVRRVRTRNGHS